MNEKEKSLELAKLMGWREFKSTGAYMIFSEYELSELKPYCSDTHGLAQFGAILLQFQGVFGLNCFSSYIKNKDTCSNFVWDKEPTQENILDEILRMNGVKL